MKEATITDKKGNGVIVLPERISSENTSDLLDRIRDEARRSGQAEILLDAENTAYVSSAGLRAFMTLKEEAFRFEIINVGPLV